MFRKNKRKRQQITNMCVWYKTKANILNLTKKSPTGGSPVKEKIRNKNKLLAGIYFCKKTRKLVVERCVNIYTGT